jgi:DNA-binding PadR family transcriptional regulator
MRYSKFKRRRWKRRGRGKSRKYYTVSRGGTRL